MRSIVFALCMALSPIPAMAFCGQPSPPLPPNVGISFRPNPPLCLQGFGSTPCDQWELNSYIRDVNNYITDLNQMVNEANNFADDAARYADDVYSYATCEADSARDGLR